VHWPRVLVLDVRKTWRDVLDVDAVLLRVV
jgi:hypothetical protein